MLSCSGFGRSIRSDIAIPGLAPADLVPPSPAGPELAIRLAGSALAPLPAESTWQRKSEGISYQIRELGEFDCQPGRLDIRAGPDADIERMLAVVVATMLPTLLWIEGGFMLHAAGVDITGSGEVFAIAGPSQSGKSTIASQLVARGGRLVGDDSLVIARGDQGFHAHGLPGGQFLANIPSENRYFHDVSRASMSPGGRLAGILVLGIAPVEWSLSRINPLEAITALRALRHRPQVPEIMEASTGSLEFCMQLASAVPVFNWQRRHGEKVPSDAEWTALERLFSGKI